MILSQLACQKTVEILYVGFILKVRFWETTPDQICDVYNEFPCHWLLLFVHVQIFLYQSLKFAAKCVERFFVETGAAIRRSFTS